MNNEREGADITAAHMIDPAAEPSNVANFYFGSNIFITGSTGFIGRLLVEKLLRSCSQLKKIYILLRTKHGKTAEHRFKEYFNYPLYERLKREQFEVLSKLAFIEGDCSRPNLGLSDCNRRLLQSEVNCVFHCAQNGDDLQTATLVNVQSTFDLLHLAKGVIDLRSIVFLSSAFSFYPRKVIEERFYSPKMSIDELISITETLETNILNATTPMIIKTWPNTLLFAQSVAEDVINKHGSSLPVAIIRPSIVVGTAKEPVAGWSDNFYGLVGLYCGISLGFIHTFKYEPNNVIDQVPADYVVNCMLAAAWKVGTTKGLNINREVCEPLQSKYWSIPIYNYVSSTQKPLTLRENIELGQRFAEMNPSILQIWHSFICPTCYKLPDMVLHFIFDVIFLSAAKLYSLVMRQQSKWSQFSKLYERANLATNNAALFVDRQWMFRNNNVEALWDQMNSEDQRAFEFNISTLDTDLYYNTLIRGSRVYILNDPVDTIPAALKQRQTLKVVHNAVIAFLILIIVKWILLII